jgi:nucleoside-diphosphate-sugar epimerase|tara:strand:+ start:1142 stop:2083 length:942 start_codon:yes stop_codon:yes gene_type:complete
MKIFITGGCGYVGTVLTNSLLDDGHNITVLDTQWFGNFLSPNKNLKLIKGNIQNLENIDFKGFNTIIHLANIANDPGVELNQVLSWEVNVLSSQQLVEKAIHDGVNHIIYASSGSVYGVKDELDVTEDLALVPISAYNKTKMVSERVFFSYKDYIKIHCIRPATVCGYSPRMRLDVSVNLLTMQALTNKIINVYGGKQTRPNINIHDMIGVYKHFLKNSEIESGFFNAGFENISILDMAKKIQSKIPSEIKITSSNDPRSYRQNSNKLIATGFKQKYFIDDAIEEIMNKFNDGKLSDNDIYYNIKVMKKIFSE